MLNFMPTVYKYKYTEGNKLKNSFHIVLTYSFWDSVLRL